MKEHTFDAMTRRAAKQVSRRTSLAALSAAGLAALAAPLPADAKKKKNDNNCKKDKQQCNQDLAACTAQAADCSAQAALCAAQVDQCTTFLTVVCEGNPDCLDSVACCSRLEDCDFNGFFACLVDAGAS
jgi:hypothetical protein